MRALIAAVALAALATPASALSRGDLLVVDAINARILRVTPNGAVSTLVPTNTPSLLSLQTVPSGIGVGPDAEIVVAQASGPLVSIDPQTGDQYEVGGLFSGPPDLGANPLDVAVGPREPAPQLFPTLYLAAASELRRVLGNALQTTGARFAAYPCPHVDGFSIAPVNTAPADPLDLLVATPSALLLCDGTQQTCAVFWSPPHGTIRGLDFVNIGAGLVLTTLHAGCGNAASGIYAFYPGLSSEFEPLLTGMGDVACPGPIAFDGADPLRSTIYVVAHGESGAPRIVAVRDGGEGGFTQTLVSTLPDGPFATTLATDLAACALLVLLALAKAPRRLVVAGIAGCTVLAAGTPAGAVQLRAGDLLVTDAVNARVLHVDPATGVVTPFSPRANVANLLFAPAGIAIDPDGAVFVADSFADRIVRIDPTTGVQSVVHDFSAQFGDFGPSDVGTAPQGIDLEDTVSGLDRRDLFVASADGLHRVSRSSDATSTASISSAADVLLGTDVSVQETYLGEPYSLWVVADGVLVRWYFENGATQVLTASNARNVRGVEYALGVPLFTRQACYEASSLNGLFVHDGPYGGTQLEYDGFASCLGRPLSVASSTLVYGTYGDADVVALVPEIGGYASEIIATLPAGDVPAVAADLAVSPVTFPAPEPRQLGAGAVSIVALAGLCRRRARPRGARFLATATVALVLAASAGASVRPGDVLIVDERNDRVLRVEPASGDVTVFSPPPDGENLLSSPSGIGVGPDGTIVVANESGWLTQIDPTSGVQTAVAGVFSGPPDVGVEPQDVAVNPRTPSPGFAPSLYVGAKDELRLVRWNALATDGSQLAPFSPAWIGYETDHLSLWAPDDAAPFDVFASIAAAVLRYDGDQDAILDYWVPPVGFVHGIDVAPGDTPTVGIAWRKGPCPSAENGIYLVNPFGQAIESAWSTGGLLDCPRGLAWFGSFDAYTLADGDPPRLIELDATAFSPPVVAQRVVATLPSGTNPTDLAVYVSEPSALLGPAAAVLGLAGLARRRTIR